MFEAGKQYNEVGEALGGCTAKHCSGRASRAPVGQKRESRSKAAAVSRSRSRSRGWIAVSGDLIGDHAARTGSRWRLDRGRRVDHFGLGKRWRRLPMWD